MNLFKLSTNFSPLPNTQESTGELTVFMAVCFVIAFHYFQRANYSAFLVEAERS